MVETLKRVEAVTPGRCAPRRPAGTVPADDPHRGRPRRAEGAARRCTVIRVGVLGAAGVWAGRSAGRSPTPRTSRSVAAVDPRPRGAEVTGLRVRRREPEALAGVDVAVDFTPSTSASWRTSDGVCETASTPSWARPASARRPGRRSARRPTRGRQTCIVAPNFALGAVLLLRFAAEAARYFDAAEVIELHHDGKVDAPSGTAIATARAIAAARTGDRSVPEAVDPSPARAARTSRGCACTRSGSRVCVAHEEVVFGGTGQTLHDAPRHDRPVGLHARRAARDPCRRRSSGPHGRSRRASRLTGGLH